jgi:hypothetical protein
MMTDDYDTVLWCPQCGLSPKIDEDGCCAVDGCDTGEIPNFEQLRRERDDERARVAALNDIHERMVEGLRRELDEARASHDGLIVARHRVADELVAQLSGAQRERDDLRAELRSTVDATHRLMSEHERHVASLREKTNAAFSSLSEAHVAQGRAEGQVDGLRAELAMFDVDALAFTAMGEKFLDEIKVGKAHPAQPNMMKYAGTELNKRRHELLMATGGSAALEWDSEGSGGGAKARTWLRTKANSIEGGTSEVMLNVISKRILDLPGA